MTRDFGIPREVKDIMFLPDSNIILCGETVGSFRDLFGLQSLVNMASCSAQCGFLGQCATRKPRNRQFGLIVRSPGIFELLVAAAPIWLGGG